MESLRKSISEYNSTWNLWVFRDKAKIPWGKATVTAVEALPASDSVREKLCKWATGEVTQAGPEKGDGKE